MKKQKCMLSLGRFPGYFSIAVLWEKRAESCRSFKMKLSPVGKVADPIVSLMPVVLPGFLGKTFGCQKCISASWN